MLCAIPTVYTFSQAAAVHHSTVALCSPSDNKRCSNLVQMWRHDTDTQDPGALGLVQLVRSHPCALKLATPLQAATRLHDVHTTAEPRGSRPARAFTRYSFHQQQQHTLSAAGSYCCPPRAATAAVALKKKSLPACSVTRLPSSTNEYFPAAAATSACSLARSLHARRGIGRVWREQCNAGMYLCCKCVNALCVYVCVHCACV